MNNGFNKESAKNVLGVGLLLILAYWAINNINLVNGYLSAIFGLFMPFIIGGVIAFIINVPMSKIEKYLFKSKKYKTSKIAMIRRVCAYAITLILFAVVISMIILVVAPQLAITITDIVSTIPSQLAKFSEWLAAQLTAFPEIENTLNSITIDWAGIFKSAFGFLSNGTIGIITGGIGAVSGIISGFTSFFIGFVFSIYILFQKEKLSRQVKKVLYAMLSEKRAERIIYVARLANTTFANFLSGQCLEAVILGTMFFITMTILRMPYALLIGVVIATTALIPIVGAFIGCVLGVILIALTNPVQALIFVVVFLVLQQIEGNLIYPHVVGNSVGLPGIWVLVAVSVGGSLFGVMGMLTFIPICSVVYALFRVYINKKLEMKNFKEDKI